MKDMTMDEGAIAQHEVFMSYMRAGFTREEAFQLVLEIMKAAALGH